jgi:hypothetical protein
MFVRIVRNVRVFMTWKSQGHLASWTKFGGDAGTELFETRKTVTLPKKLGRVGPQTVTDVSKTKVLRSSEMSVTVYLSTRRTHPGMLEYLATPLWYPEISQVFLTEKSVLY